MASPVVGEQVLFVPDEHRWHECDRHGKPVWRFLHEKTGEEITPEQLKHEDPAMRGIRHENGRLVAGPRSHPVKFGGPLYYWPAVIRELYDDGTVGLDVKHPCGFVTCHEVHRRYDPKGKALGTWHRAGD